PPAHGPALGGGRQLHDRDRRHAGDPRGPGEGPRPVAGPFRGGAASASLLRGRLAALVVAQEPSRDVPPPGVVTSLTLFAGAPSGLWRTRDWGRTWERVEGALPARRLEGLGAARAIVPLGPQVWVGGDGGLFVSTDFGETWELRSATSGIVSLLFSRWPQSDPP